MRLALDLAREGLGRTAPNPSVGCLAVKGGQIIAQARTADKGRPHAEMQVLEAANMQGADLYVTLEPCQNCSRAIIAAKPARLIVACTDLNPAVREQGFAMLREAGIDVMSGVLEQEAAALNTGFFLSKLENRPLVTLKMAISADGKIAGARGAPVQISGPKASAHMHRSLRATHDAVAVGMNTVINDNPALTTRVEGLEHYSIPVVFGDPDRLPSDAQIKDRVIVVNEETISDSFAILAQDHGITRLLIEGGVALMQSVLGSGLWDKLYIYHSPIVIGDDGLNAPDFGDNMLIDKHNIGNDVLRIYQPTSSAFRLPGQV